MGAVKTFEAVHDWVLKRAERKLEAQRRIESIDEKIDKIVQRLDEIDERLAQTDEQTATLQNEKLTWAYVHYGVKKNPISLDTRSSLERMYEQYAKSGRHNHVPTDFVDKLHEAPIDM